MKKVVLCITLVLTTILIYSCQKETIADNQAGQSRVLSSNPDEIFVQDEQTGEWITWTDYKKIYGNVNKAETYGNKLCKICNEDGYKFINATWCGTATYSNCSNTQDPCKPNS